MLEGALLELFWVFVVLGIPMLLAYGKVQWDKKKQKRKDDQIFKTVEEYRNGTG